MATIDGLRPVVKRLAKELIAECLAQGITIKVIQGLRTKSQQDVLYAKGRTVPGGIVTNARGGHSYHNYGLAFDICPVKQKTCEWNAIKIYTKVGSIGRKLGLEWGGDWKMFRDYGHFQYSVGYSIANLLNNRVDWSKFD